MFRKFFLFVLLVFIVGKGQASASMSYIRAGALSFDEEVSAYGGGIGTRYMLGPFNILDLSCQGYWIKKQHRSFYAIPRVAFLCFINPQHSCGLYGGIAGSWAYSRESHENGWQVGLQIEAVVGLEFGRGSPIGAFVEVSHVLPTLRILGKRFHSHHKPFNTVTLGIGF